MALKGSDTLSKTSNLWKPNELQITRDKPVVWQNHMCWYTERMGPAKEPGKAAWQEEVSSTRFQFSLKGPEEGLMEASGDQSWILCCFWGGLG